MLLHNNILITSIKLEIFGHHKMRESMDRQQRKCEVLRTQKIDNSGKSQNLVYQTINI